MAAKFSLTAQMILQAPTNTAAVITQLRNDLAKANLSAAISIDTKAALKEIANLQKKISTPTKMPIDVDLSRRANAVIANLKQKLTQGSTIPINVSVGGQSGLNQINKQISSTKQNLQQTTDVAEKFGESIAYAAKKFAAYTIATGLVIRLAGAFSNSVKEAIGFQNEMVKIAQITGGSLQSVKGLSEEITRLSTGLGVSSKALLDASQILAQAGLSAKDVKTSLEAIAKSDVAPTFENINQTTEGSVAIFSQFKIKAEELEGVLGQMNAVSGKFAVESGDLITAIRRTGGAFKSSGGSLKELLALFTSVRQTTRESAESIATGFRTIFTRLQRVRTVNFLKDLGIDLRNSEGQFVGPINAIQRLSEALKDIPSTDPRYAQIIEELGGFRQVSKVIPLIQEFGITQKALAVATQGTTSLTEDAITSQQSWARQIQKVREEFEALIRTVGDNNSFKTLLTLSLKLASAFIQIADSVTPLLPLIATGFAAKAFSSRVPTRVAKGVGIGNFLGFNRGGPVPGVGSGDTVPAALEPGEFVVRKKAVEAFGMNNLHKINRYAGGGKARVNKVTNVYDYADSIRDEEVKNIAKFSNMTSDFYQHDIDFNRRFVINPPGNRTKLLKNKFGLEDSDFIENAISDTSMMNTYYNQSLKQGMKYQMSGKTFEANQQIHNNYEQINKIARKHKLDRDIITYTGLSRSGNKSLKDFIETNGFGGIFNPNRIISSSANLSQALEFAIPVDNEKYVLKIQNSKGQTGIPLPTSEAELMIPNGSGFRLLNRNVIDNLNGEKTNIVNAIRLANGGIAQKFAEGGQPRELGIKQIALALRMNENDVRKIKAGNPTEYARLLQQATFSKTARAEDKLQQAEQSELSKLVNADNIPNIGLVTLDRSTSRDFEGRKSVNVDGSTYGYNLIHRSFSGDKTKAIDAARPGIYKSMKDMAINMATQLKASVIPRDISVIPNVQGVIGSIFEGAIASLGSPYDGSESHDSQNRRIDFPAGIGPVGGTIFSDARLGNIPVEAKKTYNDDSLKNLTTKVAEGFRAKRFASGGIAKTEKNLDLLKAKDYVRKLLQKSKNAGLKSEFKGFYDIIDSSAIAEYDPSSKKIGLGPKFGEFGARGSINHEFSHLLDFQNGASDEVGDVLTKSIMNDKLFKQVGSLDKFLYFFNQKMKKVTGKSINRAGIDYLGQPTELIAHALEGLSHDDVVKTFTSEGVPTKKLVRGLRNTLVDKFMLPSNLKRKQFAKGGQLSSNISNEDTIPALLTPGEYVVNQESAKAFGYHNLEKINKMEPIRGYNSGGIVQKFAAGGRATGNTNTNNDNSSLKIFAVTSILTALSAQFAKTNDTISKVTNTAVDMVTQFTVLKTVMSQMSDLTSIYSKKQRLAAAYEAKRTRLTKLKNINDEERGAGEYIHRYDDMRANQLKLKTKKEDLEKLSIESKNDFHASINKANKYESKAAKALTRYKKEFGDVQFDPVTRKTDFSKITQTPMQQSRSARSSARKAKLESLISNAEDTSIAFGKIGVRQRRESQYYAGKAARVAGNESSQNKIAENFKNQIEDVYKKSIKDILPGFTERKIDVESTYKDRIASAKAKFDRDQKISSSIQTGSIIASSAIAPLSDVASDYFKKRLEEKVGDKGVQQGYVASKTVGGVAQGVVAGALVGATFGPVGAAIGAATGGIISGLYSMNDAMEETANILKKSNFDAAFRKLSKSLESINAEEARTLTKLGEVTSSFNRAYTIFQGATGDTKTDLKGQLNTSTIGLQTIFNNTLTELARSGQDVNEIYSQFAATIGPKTIEQYSNILNIPISETTDEFKKFITNIKIGQNTVSKQKIARSSLDNYFEILNVIPSSFNEANASINTFTSQLQLLITGTKNYNSTLGDIAEFTNLTPRHFNAILGETSRNVGFAGPSGGRLVNQANQAYTLSRDLPRILIEALGGDRTTSQVDENVISLLKGFDIEIQNSIRGAFENIIGEEGKPQKLINKLSNEFTQTTDSIKGILKKNFIDPLSNINKYVEEFNKKQGDLLNQRIVVEGKIIETLNKESAIRGGFLKVVAQANKTDTPVNLATIESQDFNQRQINNLAFNPITRNASPFLLNNPSNIDTRLQQVKAETLNPNTIFKAEELANAKDILIKNLEELANPANTAGVALAKLTEASERASARFDLAKSLATGSSSDRRDIKRTLDYAKRVSATSSFDSIPNRFRDKVSSLLGGSLKAGLPEITGLDATGKTKRGEDVIKDATFKYLVEKEGYNPAVAKAVVDESTPAKDAALDEVKKAYTLSLEANNVLKAYFEDDKNKISYVLQQAFATFNDNLKNVFNAQITSTLQNQLGQNAARQQVARGNITAYGQLGNRVKEVSGVSVDDLQLRTLIGLKDQASQVSKQRALSGKIGGLENIAKNIDIRDSSAGHQNIDKNYEAGKFLTKDLNLSTFSRFAESTDVNKIKNRYQTFLTKQLGDDEDTKSLINDILQNFEKGLGPLNDNKFKLGFGPTNVEFELRKRLSSSTEEILKNRKTKADVDFENLRNTGSNLGLNPQKIIDIFNDEQFKKLSETSDLANVNLGKLNEELRLLEAHAVELKKNLNQVPQQVNIPQIVPAKNQSGGFIGGFGSGDKVPALLEPGEFVLNRNAVQAAGAGNLQTFNKKFARFATGGSVNGINGVQGANGISDNGFNLTKVIADESLTLAMNKFSTASNTLANAMNKFPKEISLNAHHTVEVIVNGAQVLQNIMPEVTVLVENSTKSAINRMLKDKFKLGPME